MKNVLEAEKLDLNDTNPTLRGESEHKQQSFSGTLL